MPISKVNRLGLATDAQNYTIDTFTGDGSTVAFTLSQDPVSNTDLIVSVGGVLQAPTTNYTLSGTTLTFTGAPDATIPIMVTHLTYRNGAKEFTPDDGSVTSSKLAANIDIAGTLDVTGNMTAGGTLDVGGATVISVGNSGATGNTNSDELTLEGDLNVGMNILSPNDRLGAIRFGDAENNGAGKIIYDHGTNYMRIDVDGSEVARFTTDGLSFDTGSNALDDYEEGTWTPEYGGGSSSITVGNYTLQSGHYVKIGKLVWVGVELECHNVTVNSNGTFDIIGLPFTIGSSAQGAMHTTAQNNWTVAPSEFTFVDGGTSARARQGLDFGAGTYINGLASTMFNTSSSSGRNRIFAQGTYWTDA